MLSVCGGGEWATLELVLRRVCEHGTVSHRVGQYVVADCTAYWSTVEEMWLNIWEGSSSGKDDHQGKIVIGKIIIRESHYHGKVIIMGRSSSGKDHHQERIIRERLSSRRIIEERSLSGKNYHQGKIVTREKSSSWKVIIRKRSSSGKALHQ